MEMLLGCFKFELDLDYCSSIGNCLKMGVVILAEDFGVWNTEFGECGFIVYIVEDECVGWGF